MDVGPRAVPNIPSAGWDIYNDIVELTSAEKTILPSLEELLRKRYPYYSADRLNDLALANVIRHEEQWRRRTQRHRTHVNELVSNQKSRVPTLAEKRIMRHEIARLQQKDALEKRRHGERQDFRDRVSKESGLEIKLTRSAWIAEKKLIVAHARERSDVRRSLVSTPAEFRGKYIAQERMRKTSAEEQRAYTLAISQKARAFRARIADITQAALTQSQKEKRVFNAAILGKLASARDANITIAHNGIRRAAYVDSLVRPAIQRRNEHTSTIGTIEDRQAVIREEHREPTIRHLNALRLTLEAIATSLHEHRTQKREEVERIIDTGRARAEVREELSGSLRYLAHTLPSHQYFALIKKRMSAIEEALAHHQEQNRAHLDALFANSEERRKIHLLRSGNPEALRETLTSADYYNYFRARIEDILERSTTNHEKIKERLHTVIGHLQELAAYHDSLIDPPKEIGNLIHLVLLSRIVTSTNHTVLLFMFYESHNDMRIEPYSRLEQAFLLIEKLMKNPDPFSCDYLYRELLQHEDELERVKQRLLHRLGTERIGTLKTLLIHENTQSLLSGMMVDETLRRTRALEEYSAAYHQDQCGITYKSTLPGNEGSLSNIADTWSTPIPDSLLTILPETKAEHTGHDEAYTPLCHLYPEGWYPLEKNIKEGLRLCTLVNEADLFSPTPIDETKAKEALIKEEECEEKREKAAFDKIRAQRENLVRLIEEQNKTAHEKTVDERNLIDFFF